MKICHTIFATVIALPFLNSGARAGFLEFPLQCSNAACSGNFIDYRVHGAYTAGVNGGPINSILDHRMYQNANGFYPYGRVKDGGGNGVLRGFDGETVSGGNNGDDRCIVGTIKLPPYWDHSQRMTNDNGCGSGYSSYDEHPGYDYKADYGTPVYAAASGHVLKNTCYVGNMGGTCKDWGAVGILHDSGYITQYLHMSKLLVSAEDYVSVGQQIGEVGDTCYKCTIGAHLHFEVRATGKEDIQPEKYPIVDPYGWAGKGSDSLYSANAPWSIPPKKLWIDYYTFDPAGSLGTSPQAVNAANVVTGSFFDGVNTHGFIRTDNGITVFDVAGASATVPLSINNAGSVAGWACASSCQGFIRDPKGGFTPVDIPNSKMTLVFGINNKGTVTGRYQDTNGGWHGFIRDASGNVTAFDVQGETGDTYPLTINSLGLVAGYYFIGQYEGSFIRAPNGRITTFDVGGNATVALSINALGEVTGNYSTHGFARFATGTVITFDFPNAVLTYPTALNDAGKVTGYYRDVNGNFRGFVREPNGFFRSIYVPNSTLTRTNAISQSGAIVGTYEKGDGVDHGFVRD